MENKNVSTLFQNCLIVYPDLVHVIFLNNLYKSEEKNFFRDNFNWKILSENFCNILEFITTNKSDIFASFNLFESIKANNNTFIYSAFEFLNLLSPEKFNKEERKLEEILAEFENFVKEKIDNKMFLKEEIFLSIIIILYIFLQEATTGSSFMFIKESEKTDFSKDLQKFSNNNFFVLENNISENLRSEFYEYLTVNGEVPFRNIKLIFLYIICYKMFIKSDIFDCFEVKKLYKSRILLLHDKMLKDQTCFIKQEIFKCFESFNLDEFKRLYENNSEANYNIEDFKILQGLLKLEKSFICIRYYQYKECESLIEDAKSLFGLSINLTGRLGRKTKFQEFDVPVLVIESNSSTLEKAKELIVESPLNNNEKLTSKEISQNKNLEKDDNSPENTSDCKESSTYSNENYQQQMIEESPTGIPKQVMLSNENPLLEKPNITDKTQIDSTSLSLYDQLYVTALLNSFKHTYPDEDLLREVILTYVNKSIEKSYDWLVFSKLLLHRSLAEEKKTKTIERSLLQIESLCLQYNDRLPNSFSRMKFIFIVDYPFIWKLKKFYAEMFMSYGAFITAFDLFEELGMYEECVYCLYLAGKNERALKFAEDALKKNEDPGIYCILGEINRKEEYYHKALEVSKGKYTRAYRCLGKFKMNENKVEEAIQYLEKSMEINPIFPDIWFSLGILYLKQQNWTNACRSFAKSVQLDETLAESWANLGIAFIKLKKNREALKALEEAHKCSRNNWRILENLIYAAIDCEDIQKIINGIRELFELEKQDIVTPNMFYKLITILLSKYDKLEKRQIEYFKEKIYLIFENFSMKDGTTPEIWDLYIFFIECTEIKLNTQKIEDDDVQKFYQAMIEIRLKQIRNYMIKDLWEKDQKCIEKISTLIIKLKNEIAKVKENTYVAEVNNFIETTQGKIDKYYKLKEFEKNNNIFK